MDILDWKHNIYTMQSYILPEVGRVAKNHTQVALLRNKNPWVEIKIVLQKKRKNIHVNVIKHSIKILLKKWAGAKL